MVILKLTIKKWIRLNAIFFMLHTQDNMWDHHVNTQKVSSFYINNKNPYLELLRNLCDVVDKLGLLSLIQPLWLVLVLDNWIFFKVIMIHSNKFNDNFKW